MRDDCKDSQECIDAGVNEDECKGVKCEYYRKPNLPVTEYNRRARLKKLQMEKAKNDNKLQA